MSIYNQISVIVFLLIAFGIYRLFKRRSKKSENQPSLSEVDLKPFLETLNLEIEEKVRKQWLISFFAFTGISALSILFTYFGGGAFNEFSKNTSPAFGVVCGLLIVSLALIPRFWIIYHYSYKKRGTAWLMWTMILLPLGELVDIGKGRWNEVAELDCLGWFIFITFLGIEVFFWINCLRLRRVNADRKYQRVLALKAKYGPDANGFSSTLQ